jgi:hypothetical protein
MWILSDRDFLAISLHPEHFCDVPASLKTITRPPLLHAFARSILAFSLLSDPFSLSISLFEVL